MTGTRSSAPARPVSYPHGRSSRSSFPGLGGTVKRLFSYHVSGVEVSRFWGFLKELESKGSRKRSKTFHDSGDQKIILALDAVGNLIPQ